MQKFKQNASVESDKKNDHKAVASSGAGTSQIDEVDDDALAAAAESFEKDLLATEHVKDSKEKENDDSKGKGKGKVKGKSSTTKLRAYPGFGHFRQTLF